MDFWSKRESSKAGWVLCCNTRGLVPTGIRCSYVNVAMHCGGQRNMNVNFKQSFLFKVSIAGWHSSDWLVQQSSHASEVQRKGSVLDGF